MQGLMMETPLTIPQMIAPRAETIFARRPVVSRVGDRIHRSSWGEVSQRARRLATVLQGLGVKPGDRVATFGWNSHWHLEAYLAVPSMGAVLHTLNIRLFPEQIAYIVEHADDAVILCDRSLLPVWRQVEPLLTRRRPVIVQPDAPDASADGDAIDYERAVGDAQPLAEWPEVPESAAAAMCYTSGTTGNPKGVVYSHRSTVLHTFGVCLGDAMGITAADTVLAIVPMFHANSWGIPYATAMTGASLVLPGRDLAPAALCGLIEDERCTIAAGVPTIWLGVLEHHRQRHPDLSTLRFGVCGGSALPASLYEAMRREAGVELRHGWGMTETSPLASLSSAPPEVGASPSDEERRYYVTSQGLPLPGVEIRVIGDDGAPVPHDRRSMGEIQIRGPWIARSYYRDEDQGEKFADGWLRTGDVATVDELGYMRIVDRTKDLVKSGGEWISSVELEGMIMSHPQVLEAAVIGVPDARWDERPLACVVLREEARGAVTEHDILEHLRPLVARWWLPDQVVFIDEVPKTSVGKFDKKALRVQFPAMPKPAGQD